MFFFFFFDEINKSSNKKFSSVEFKETANKGEWSELYALYKLLVDQALFPKNNKQSKTDLLSLPILSILRYTEADLKTEYRINDSKNISILADGQENIIEIEKEELEINTKRLLDAIIKGADKTAFEIPNIKDFRVKTFCPKIKCFSVSLSDGNKDKSDIYIVIHDSLTGQNPKLGFSIKSDLGSAPTLLNASKLTNFKYKLSSKLSEDKIKQINNLQDNKRNADIKNRVQAILNEGINLEFSSIDPNSNNEDIFLENLILIDSFMPQIIANLLILSQTENEKKLKSLTDKLTEINPLNFPMKANKKYYEAKVKRFISDVALGMVPGYPWEATHQAKGVLVITTEGNIDCYHVLYKETLDDYLYNNIKFETASASRHKFGTIETGTDGNQYFKLNLQLRFIGKKG